ncbi:hypothetical protein J2Z35_001183 [Acetoanaerobium pronyense]|uniref:Uncharacterized protein n=1 Tax=Acetoanaerobium pronyense TaxID=1482736 RepID=A0ABS4KHX3_9FIRM|nr:hypothetical protein [Acetoanaerobium pronyense]MBP2027389.1 hypothetical protein [Acetoanaerobium pronyense]
MFNENSMVVKTWFDLVKMKIYKREEVPALFNLRDVVYSILDREGV